MRLATALLITLACAAPANSVAPCPHDILTRGPTHAQVATAMESEEARLASVSAEMAARKQGLSDVSTVHRLGVGLRVGLGLGLGVWLRLRLGLRLRVGLRARRGRACGWRYCGEHDCNRVAA